MVWLVVLVPVCGMFGGVCVVGPEVAQEAEDWPGSCSQTFPRSLGQIPGPTPVSTRQSLRSIKFIQNKTHTCESFIVELHLLHSYTNQNVFLTIALLLLLFLEDY